MYKKLPGENYLSSTEVMFTNLDALDMVDALKSFFSMRVLHAGTNGNQIHMEQKTIFAEIWKLAEMDHLWKSGKEY